MRAGEGSVDKLAGIGVTRMHRKLIAVLDGADNLVDVGDHQPGIDPLAEQIERQGHDIDIAVNGARLIRDLAAAMPETDVVYQYSPESFTGTELDFAVEICEAVMDVWRPTPDRKTILNLPATV